MSTYATYQYIASQGLKAAGTIVQVNAHEFLRMVERQDEPLVVTRGPKVFHKNHIYLTTFKGFTFFCSSRGELSMPGKAEVFTVRSIWIPTM
jgi:hypothetical protein